ncbi:FtsX-like permease family protein [Paenibacillus sp. MMS20-IR301]|uniref:ABC transporter permease n=1 Tax=Paenibacillus sp. MMS20-IR301 TaxID=2895946 RepID=UPI0028F130EB|nr:FtsX-like permease family protein [Paenibacillus sp. MMS20-IR301]WNS41458.1 FtsX-like permease family protein [Paenibacillus sp. MMS20-IR301]
MKKRALWKDVFREISRTKARFLSIFAIIMLGVSFFAGIKSAGPDMLDTAATYYKELQLMDLRVQSTYGLTEKSVEELRGVDGVQTVQPGYSSDVFLGNSGLIGKVVSYSGDNQLNGYKVTAGHLPEASGEIVLDEHLRQEGLFALGDSITFSGEADGDLAETFRTVSYTVVGFAQSPQYIETTNRGTSRIGKGTADAFAVIPEEDFNLPVYSEVYLSFKDTAAETAYTPAYDALVERHTAEVEDALGDFPQQRLEELQAEAAAMLGAQQQQAASGAQTDAQQQAAPELPKVYVTDRTINAGYAEYKDNADRLSAIASAFPVFFFLIAALVSLTTMTRMVEEQRLQIGTMKALGYGPLDIMTKFLVYGTLASLTASIAGLAVGFTLFPDIIYNAYSQLYNLPDVIKSFYPDYAVVSIIVALVCTAMTAMIASRVELRSNASVLMRPKAPKSGQRILLERFGFLWTRLSFVQKVTARNLFRYKQRMFMTVIGVAGCTALILTGFGLKDSIGSIAGKQFGGIMKYSALVAFHDNAAAEDSDAYAQLIQEEPAVTGTLDVLQEAMTVRAKGVNDQGVRIFVPSEVQTLDAFIALQDRITDEHKTLADDGAIITEKLAKLYDLVPGDRLSVLDSNNEEFEIRVAAVTENYVLHYMYMTPAYYTEVFGEKPVYNTQLLNYSKQDRQWEDEFGGRLTANGQVAMVTFSSGVGEAFDGTMDSMDVVIVVLIVSAAALAFVVLYNLTNINVSERVRELSTIKVLGFYDQEVTMYIYRENILLTLLGIISGNALGIVLHRFVLSTAELDATMFAPLIKWQSYVYAALLTLLFSGIVMLFMHLKLKRIHMIEALKSVE